MSKQELRSIILSGLYTSIVWGNFILGGIGWKVTFTVLTALLFSAFIVRMFTLHGGAIGKK